MGCVGGEGRRIERGEKVKDGKEGGWPFLSSNARASSSSAQQMASSHTLQPHSRECIQRPSDAHSLSLHARTSHDGQGRRRRECAVERTCAGLSSCMDLWTCIAQLQSVVRARPPPFLQAAPSYKSISSKTKKDQPQTKTIPNEIGLTCLHSEGPLSALATPSVSYCPVASAGGGAGGSAPLSFLPCSLLSLYLMCS